MTLPYILEHTIQYIKGMLTYIFTPMDEEHQPGSHKSPYCSEHITVLIDTTLNGRKLTVSSGPYGPWYSYGQFIGSYTALVDYLKDNGDYDEHGLRHALRILSNEAHNDI